jgi:hypothetical protein
MQQVVSARDSQHQDHPVGDWLAANPLAALTLLGVVLYGLIRLGHSLFYSEFGLSPNEVGLGYGDALARAAGFAAYVLLFVAAILTVFWAARRKWPSRRWQIALIAFACMVSIVFVVFLARESADRVKRGELVRPIFLYDLGIRAEPAIIAWIETTP